MNKKKFIFPFYETVCLKYAHTYYYIQNPFMHFKFISPPRFKNSLDLFLHLAFIGVIVKMTYDSTPFKIYWWQFYFFFKYSKVPFLRLMKVLTASQNATLVRGLITLNSTRQ